MARKFSAFTNNPSRVPLDTLVGLDISAAAAAQNSYWSLNTLFSEITGNVTDGAIRFGGFAAPAVSAAGKGAIYFDSTANAFRVSQNAGAYAGFILGTIANTQVAVGSAAGTVTGSSAFTFASGVAAIQGTTNPGVTITGTAATESGITVNQSVSGTAADAFHSFQTPSTTVVWRLTTAGFTPTGLIKADQLDMFGSAGTVEMLFRLADASTRFVFGVNNGEAASINATSTLNLVLGADSGAAVPLTGRVRMYNSAGTTYSQISAGNAGSSLNFIWPVVNPTVGQVLSASAPSGSDVTLSWVSAAAVTSLTATQVGFGDGSNMLSGSADFTYTNTTGVLDLTKTLDSSVRMTVTNLSSGNAAQARFGATADVSFAGLIAYSSTFITSGLRTANSAVLDLDGPSAVILGQTAGTITWGLGTTARATLTDAQMAVLTAPTTGAGLAVSASTVTSGSLVSLSMTGTAAASNTKTGLAIASSGANGTASQTVFGSTISVTNTGTTNTNIALQLTASGAATANTALSITAGNLLIASGSITLTSGGITAGGTISTSGDTITSASGGVWSQPSVVELASGGHFRWASRSRIYSSADGLLELLDNAATGFTRLNFGGSTSSFPAIGRSATSLSIGLADATLQSFITPKAAASLQFGATDAAAPVAQTLSVQSVVAGTANTAGADWTRIGSRGTGTGAGGNHIWQVAPAGGAGSTQNALINGLVLTSTGQLYGSALHNNSAAVTGTINQYIASGTYTPTVTAVANCTATSSGVCNWIRVGNAVTVSGTVAIDPTATTTFTSVGISLPIASNFVTDPSECAGVAACANVAGYAGAIVSDTTNDRAQLNFTTVTDVANQPWSFTFTYVVL